MFGSVPVSSPFCTGELSEVVLDGQGDSDGEQHKARGAAEMRLQRREAREQNADLADATREQDGDRNDGKRGHETEDGRQKNGRVPFDGKRNKRPEIERGGCRTEGERKECAQKERAKQGMCGANRSVSFLKSVHVLCADLFAMRTRLSMTGTSTRTPTTVASATGEVGPKSEIATTTESSKKFEAPIIAAGAAIACGRFNWRQMKRETKKIM